MLFLTALVLALPPTALPQDARTTRAAATTPKAKAALESKKQLVDWPLESLTKKLELSRTSRLSIEAILQRNAKASALRSAISEQQGGQSKGRAGKQRASSRNTGPATVRGGPKPAHPGPWGLGVLPITVIDDIRDVVPSDQTAKLLALLGDDQWRGLRELDKRRASAQKQQLQKAGKKGRTPPAAGPPPRPVSRPAPSGQSGRKGKGGKRGGRGSGSRRGGGRRR